MKRIQDKIKDLIELQPYDEVQNFVAEPARILTAYRFTNVTSELMVRWLDALAGMPRTSGAARALAGMRGVGKSHLLAAFGALAAMPELSATISDSHVASSARRLAYQRSLIVNVQRGTRPTLEEELCSAFSATFGNDESEWQGDPSMMLAIAASRAGETPLVVILDTAFGRQTRVTRDDGPLLSALAEATKGIRAFVGLALDDDIASAEGANASIVSTYQIDYLDPEHLYQVADIHLFHKSNQGRAALHEVYSHLRNAIPGFNWSAPRFATVYPVHPVVMDVSSAVRLYAPTFAFLPFAATSFHRVANRPAHSLVALDEVFDRAEFELRKSEELKEAFEAYDKTLNETISTIPVMQRLQAKLALKCLFILSLDGRGANAKELAAASLIYDEGNPENAITRLREMLKYFTGSAALGGSLRVTEEGEDARYCFDISSSHGFDVALTEATNDVSDNTVTALFRNLAKMRFDDWPFPDTFTGEQINNTADVHFIWRGMGRRGKIHWESANASFETLSERVAAEDTAADIVDWEIVMLAPDLTLSQANEESAPTWTRALAVWKPAPLTKDELDTLKRLAALKTNSALYTNYGDAAHAAERMHTSLAERIWTRIYVEEGKLILGDSSRSQLPDDARAARSLTEALSWVITPILSARYPLHPIFTEPLGLNEVMHLVVGLFGGANQNAASVQELARLFAAPLGLVSQRSDSYALEAGDQILRQPWVRELAMVTDEAKGEVVPLNVIYQKLRKEPYGLLREAQQLVLSSLIAQRRIELVTKSGERIGRRMLDHRLIWDEITGVARSAALLHSAEELTEWARLLTQNDNLDSINDPAAREGVRSALGEWLNQWRASRLVERFEALPEDALVTRAWRIISTAAQRYNIAAEAVETALVDIVSLEEGLQRVADIFNDSSGFFEYCYEQLKELENYINGLEPREKVRRYLAAAEPTNADEIENARLELINLLDDPYSPFDAESNKRFNLLWREFQMRYSQHYAAAHAITMNSPDLKNEINAIFCTDNWREFEALSRLEIINKEHWENAMYLMGQARNARCELNVRQVLLDRPACACPFRLASMNILKQLPRELESVMRIGLASYKHALRLLAVPLANALEDISHGDLNPEIASRARNLSQTLSRSEIPERFTSAEVGVLELALQHMTTPPPVRVHLPVSGYGLLTREELRARLNQWVDDLPSEPALVEITTGDINSN